MSEEQTARTRLADAFADGPRAVARSHRLHRPRGGWCARGSCQQCPLSAGGELACETPADGSAPRATWDPLRPLGLVGERMEPWFYEHRFLRPRWARQPALEVMRRLSAAAALPDDPAGAPAPEASLRCNVLVVGGGPAGLGAAAAIAADADVAVVTRARLGGSLAAPDGDIAQQVGRLRDAGATLLPDTRCLGAFDDGRFLLRGAGGTRVIRAERVVVATGAYDRPLIVPGVDLPGVIGARAFAALAAQEAFTAGHRIGVFGGPAEVDRVRAAAARAGIEPAWVVGPHETRLLEIRGRRRARAVRFADGADRAADVVVLGFTQPTFELQLMLGQVATLEGSPPVIGTTGPAELPMLVVGEAIGDAGPGIGGRAAGAAAGWLAGEGAAATPAAAVAPATGPPAPHAIVCSCEDVRVRDVDAAIAEGFGHPELLKRRTGAATGPCQGKLCLPLVAELVQLRRLPATLPTVRPPIRPVAIGDLAATVAEEPA